MHVLHDSKEKGVSAKEHRKKYGETSHAQCAKVTFARIPLPESLVFQPPYDLTPLVDVCVCAVSCTLSYPG